MTARQSRRLTSGGTADLKHTLGASRLLIEFRLSTSFQIVITQTTVECRRGDAEYLGRLAAVPSGLFECRKDLLPFNFAKRSGR